MEGRFGERLPDPSHSHRERAVRQGMSEQNKAIVRRCIEEVIDQNRVSTVDEPFDEACSTHTPMSDMRGPEGMKAFIARVRGILPDVRATVEVMGVMYHWKGVTLPEILVYRIANGKIAERWFIADRLGLWQQLGAIPSSTPAR